MKQPWRIVFVGDKPYRVWHADSVVSTARFLDGVGYNYFSILADVYEAQLAREDAWAVRLAIRTTYGQALEAFFALLFATLQAPFDPAAWLLLYHPGDIAKLLRRFEDGEALPSFIVLPEPRSWESIVRLFHPLEPGDVDAPDESIASFANLWKELSLEMLDPVASAEYNALKHGLRAKEAGHTLLIGGHQIIDSEHGSWFPFLEHNNANVFVRFAARTWSPDRLCATLRLLAISISNLIIALRQLSSPKNPPPLVLTIPSEEEFLAAKPGGSDLSSFELGPTWIKGGEKPSPVDRQEALRWYQEYSRPLINRRLSMEQAPNPGTQADS